jgi:uncharacterized protein with gpF-like domain
MKLIDTKVSKRHGQLRTASWLVALAIVGCVSALQAEEPSASPAKADRKVSVNVRNEILKLEDRLREAIEKRDSEALDHLLADYYTDAMEEGERALSKRGALLQCEAGKLDSLSIKKPEITQNADRITVAGRSNMTVKDEKTGKTEARPVQVHRVWTQKDGQWFLGAQLRGLVDEREKERPN